SLLDQLRRPPQVPPGHHVGVSVVVDGFVVLVGAHDAVDVRAALAVAPDATRPVAGRADQELTARTGDERCIAAPRRLLVGGPGDVGDDVLLLHTSADRDALALWPDNAPWGHVRSIGRRLPREPRTGEAKLGRGLAGDR